MISLSAGSGLEHNPADKPFFMELYLKCPYCGCKARKVTGQDIYPHRKKLWKRKYFACVPCDAYVGCHDVHGHKYKAFGPLANRELRRLRQKAHGSFDPIWQDNHMKRNEAYAWLASAMRLTVQETHIGMFDEDQCRKAICFSNQKMASIRRGVA
jgi:hypothetical protein